MQRNSIGGALSLQIQHKTRLQLFADFSSDDVLSAVLLSDSEDRDDSAGDDDTSTAMDVDEAESQFENIDDIASTLPMPYRSDTFSRIDLLETTLDKLKSLNAPTPDSLSPTGWEKHLRKLLVGEAEPAYRVCRLHGSCSRYYLKATCRIQQHEALGVLVGRLIETKRWEKKHALEKKEKLQNSAENSASEDDELDALEADSSKFRWEITADALKKISNGEYNGPDLMIDLRDAANELVHLHDPFWEEEGACGEEANTKLYTSLIKDPRTGVSLPTTVLYSTCDIKKGETLTVNWDDAYWSEVSEKENLTAAATAWGSLHFPLLQLRDLAFRNGIPVSIVAPYYPDEIENYKRQKKEIQVHQNLGTTATPISGGGEPGGGNGGAGGSGGNGGGTKESPQVLVEDSPASPSMEIVIEEDQEEEQEQQLVIQQHEQQQQGDVVLEDELEPTEIIQGDDDDGESVENLESSDAPSIHIEFDTSSHMGTFTDGHCSDEVMYNDDAAGKKRRRRRKKKNATKMFMDSEGSWWLNDGNNPRLLIEGAYKKRTTSTNTTTNVACTTSKSRATKPVTAAAGTSKAPTKISTFSPTKISLFRNQTPVVVKNKSGDIRKNAFQPFRAITEEELSALGSYNPHCDFSQVPDVVLRKVTKHAPQAQPLPPSVLKSIDTGVCPKIEITEILSLHHPVRFLTRPDRLAFGVNVKPGCRLQPNEPLGIYVGEVWGEKEYLEQRGNDVDKQMYTYSMTPYNLAECLGFNTDWIDKHATSKFPTLLVDAYASGNAMRFINDVYARQGNPRPNVGAEACIDPRTGLPYMLMRWIGEHRSEENAELMVDYGATQYWKVGGRALHRDLKRHAEVAFTAMQRLKAVLKERGVREELIEAAAEPVDANKLESYQRMME